MIYSQIYDYATTTNDDDWFGLYNWNFKQKLIALIQAFVTLLLVELFSTALSRLCFFIKSFEILHQFCTMHKNLYSGWASFKHMTHINVRTSNHLLRLQFLIWSVYLLLLIDNDFFVLYKWTTTTPSKNKTLVLLIKFTHFVLPYVFQTTINT